MIHRVDVDVNMLGCANKLCAQQTPLVHTDVLFMRRIHARPAQAACGFVWGGNPCIPCIFMLGQSSKYYSLPMGACADHGATGGVFRPS